MYPFAAVSLLFLLNQKALALIYNKLIGVLLAFLYIRWLFDYRCCATAPTRACKCNPTSPLCQNTDDPKALKP